MNNYLVIGDSITSPWAPAAEPKRGHDRSIVSRQADKVKSNVEKQNLKQTTHINTVPEVDVWVSRKLYSNVTIDANGFTPEYGNQRLNRPLRKLNPHGESQRREWGREEHSTPDAPNRRMTKHRAEENMTSAHSAKETEKWQLTEDETPAKTANPSLRSRMNTLSTQRVTTSPRAKEWRTIGSLRSKPRRKTQNRVRHKCETLPKVQNSQLKMKVSTKLRQMKNKSRATFRLG